MKTTDIGTAFEVGLGRHETRIAVERGAVHVDNRAGSVLADRLDAGQMVTVDAAVDAVLGRPVTGLYDLRDPVAAFNALAKAYGCRVIWVTPWLLILSPG